MLSVLISSARFSSQIVSNQIKQLGPNSRAYKDRVDNCSHAKNKLWDDSRSDSDIHQQCSVVPTDFA